MNDNFDMGEFMRKASANAGTDSELWREQMQADVEDRIHPVMHYMGPRLLAVIKRATMMDPQNVAHQNAVMNGVVYTVATWLAAVIPAGVDNDDNDNAIVDLVAESLRNAMKHRSEQILSEVGNLSMLGERYLIEDVNQDVVRIMDAQVAALNEIAKRLDR